MSCSTIHVQIYIKKFKAELNKTKDCIFSCKIKEGTHMLLVRDARSSVTGAPIAQKNLQINEEGNC